MCGGGLGKTLFDIAAIGGGSLLGGEFLAPLLETGGALDVGLGVGSTLATGIGSAVGGAAGGLASGEKPLQALETGGISGLTAGVASEIGGGSFLGGDTATPAPTATASTAPGIGTTPTGTSFSTPITGGTGASAAATPTGLGNLSGDVSQPELFPTSVGGGGGGVPIAGGSTDLFPSSVDTGAPTGSFLDSQPGTSATAPGGANVGSQGTPNVSGGSPFSPNQAISGESPVGGNTFNYDLGGNAANSGIKISDLGAGVESGGASGTGFFDHVSDFFTGGGGAPSAATIASNDAVFSSLPNFGGNSLSGDAAASVGASAPAAAVSQPSSFSEIFDNPGSIKGYEDLITRNPGILLSGGLGLASLAKQAGAVGNTTPKGQNQIEQIASTQKAQGQQLEGYLQSGTLPPGLQTNINQAANSAKAAIRSKYAAMGMSGSSAEQTDLANVDAQSQAQAAQIAQQLLTTGINETGMAAGLYAQLMNDSLQSDAGMSKSISDFAAAMAGGGRGGITLQLPGQISG